MNDKGKRRSLNVVTFNERAYGRSAIGNFLQKLSTTFQNAADSDHENLKKLNHDNDVNILMGGDGISNRMSLQAVLAHNHLTIEKKHKEFIDLIWNLTYQQILENIREAQKQISEAISRMNDVINQTDEHIARIHESLQNITRRHQKLNDAIEEKYFEKDGDGQYSSKAVNDTIVAYELRTKEKLPDDLSPDMLILILNAQQDFEKNEIVPVLESNLVKLNGFRDSVQNQKEIFEEENKRINEALEAIDADMSLNDEVRRSQKAEILKGASETALDAQMVAHSAEAEYDKIVEDMKEENGLAKDTAYLEQSNNETVELNQSALDDLQNIKPLLPPSL